MKQRKWQPLALGVVMALTSSSGIFAAQAVHGLRGALDSGDLGLHAGSEFRLTTGQCKDCATIPQALWYFRDDVVAVPTHDSAGFYRARRAQEDVAAWSQNGSVKGSLPPLAWVGSPLIAEGWRLDSEASNIISSVGEKLPFSVVEKIPSNLSYYDATSRRYFAGRTLSLRGRLDNGRFTARTLWPDDFNLSASSLEKQPLADGETLLSLVRAENGGGLACPWHRASSGNVTLASPCSWRAGPFSPSCSMVPRGMTTKLMEAISPLQRGALVPRANGETGW